MFRLIFILLVFTSATTAQVGIGTTSPEGALDIFASNSGVLFPRVALTAKNVAAPVLNPDGGLLAVSTVVYNTATAGVSPNVVKPGYYYWSGTDWVSFATDTNLDYLGIPRTAVFESSSNISNFLNGIGAGGKQNIPMTEITNHTGSNGLTFNSATNQITFNPGVYQISFAYEGTHNRAGCTVSSHFVDFPVGSGSSTRIHSTATHNSGGTSNYGGIIQYVTKITSTRVWTIALGRGQSGNCYGTGNFIRGVSTQLSILRLSDD
ncbi:hypothetical protein [Flavivirga spongiicola]|uniref:C1q domain-containing protein n=1 Tax=Flavivirga spongiicola TaxID=421621 RepID=A0ABU7XRS9_9FLAO|nr:hypothetical protein [Flavivirga sp. MEBiC05379]MDO5978490.1 hypothetical protein [Flavivirga sp. MEBiC05379]